MSIKRRVFRDPFDVQGRLDELGLMEEKFRAAVEVGHAARNSCTPHDPRAMAGFLAWGKGLRSLRDGMATVPPLWVSAVVDQIDVVINHKTGVAITVASGDKWTGTANDPTTKYPRGGAIVSATLTNARQLSLFIVPPPPPKIELSIRQLWLLLVYEDTDEVRAELSLPDTIDESNRVILWTDRIILNPVKFDPASSFGADDDPADDIDVPVSRKG